MVRSKNLFAVEAMHFVTKFISANNHMGKKANNNTVLVAVESLMKKAPSQNKRYEGYMNASLMAGCWHQFQFSRSTSLTIGCFCLRRC